jgi:alpha-D-xyloside xylohydrolase
LSSKGYGILWNNPSLTDFNPADESVAIDSGSGKGKFTTGPNGRYGFLLTSDNKNQLDLRVNGQEVIDIQNMWTPTSVSAALQLKGGTDYEVSARGGPGGVQLAVRPPQNTTSFRSEVGEAMTIIFFTDQS